MIAGPTLATLLWLQQVPPRVLVFGMTIAYVLCFAGLIFAYLSYRRRRRSGDKTGKGEST